MLRISSAWTGRFHFNSIEELGALPYPSFVVWTGNLVAPKTGLYHFDIDVDDAGWLKIDGKSVIEDPGDNPRYHDRGGVYLTAGVHPIEVGERNLVGGSSIRLTWQPPDGAGRNIPIVPVTALDFASRFALSVGREE